LDSEAWKKKKNFEIKIKELAYKFVTNHVMGCDVLDVDKVEY
jgi:hypothetical protein